MKNNIYKSLFILLLAGGVNITFNSCGEDFLETEYKGAFPVDTYFKDDRQCYSAVVATYDGLKKYASGFENMITFFNAGSDDFYSGGGSATDGAGIQGFNNYSIDPIKMPRSYWKDFYVAIANANIVIEKVPEAPISDVSKNRYVAEAKALRSLYYFELVRMFGNVPLILKPIQVTDDYYNIPQANPKDVYAQIEADLVDAIPNLPVTVSGDEKGRLSQGSAKALLGKIYLYDKKNDLAAAQFADVNGNPGQTNQYGYKLVADYNSLWITDNKFTSEGVFEVMYTNKSESGWDNWGWGNDEGNSVNIMVAPRSYSINTNYPGTNDAPDIVAGWSFDTVTESLFNFMQGDPRANATILNMKSLKDQNKASYGPANLDTGYFLNKYMPTKDEVTTGQGASELNYRQNYIMIRLADTYLMEAEALGGTGARAQILLDAVRARVGLASVPVSMQAIKDERRRELAGEGHRWFDLVRWGDAPTALANKGFITGKNEILPIPYEELTNTAIKQNPGYN
ncbi:hypothetical protein J2X97_001275 [Epilithonimonas hungarica]|uniref:RagB/SusD family nutrient uptake outer membrane protein n=1 Tax=Epilithonimonas hungarica TaxID=454006 RepID=UPI00278056D9|nr:RagB/SusD family nutrient uptake outer membrane protein [Epilithonimonas hungarica]MDP9955638.1 hypothetical protein [Epilithonimonas hungarica]